MTDEPDTIRVFIPLTYRHRNGKPRIIVPEAEPEFEARVQDPHILRALGRAWAWRRKLESGEAATIHDIAVAENVTDRFVSRMMRLAYLSPDVLERLLLWREPPALSLTDLIKASYLPWAEQMGRVFEALEKSGQAANTWIFFTADHGLAVGHHGLFGKQNMYEHSLRVPFMVAGPGVKAGHRISAPIYLQDVMPTVLELAGVPKPAHVDFHSLLPLLRGERTQSAYPSIYGGYLELQRAVIHEGWKLIVYPKARVMRLFDLTADPHEMKDLADAPAHAARRQQLFTRLLTLQRELDDRLDLRAAFPAL